MTMKNRKQLANYRASLKLIRNLVLKAAYKVKPLKVILFGSYAYGSPDKDSDVDLLFIKETELRGIKRYCLVSQQIERLFPVDLLVKTPQEVAKRLRMGDPFYKEIMKKGKIIYDSSR